MLNVLGQKFQVLDCAPSLEASGLHARLDISSGSIGINGKHAAYFTAFALFHEIIHAVVQMGHWQFLLRPGTFSEHNEADIDALASIMLSILRDNHLLNEMHLWRITNDGIGVIENGNIRRIIEQKETHNLVKDTNHQGHLHP